MGAATPLQALQQDLQEIYALNVAHDVNDFLCTDRELALFLGGGRVLRGVRENLFVKENGGELNLSLFLDPDVIAALDSAARDSRAGRLDDYCLALEGVSHFLYLVWYASHARSVTLLEMELQAEIDKYIMLRGVLYHSGVPLLQRLFRDAVWQQGLAPDELVRYREANRLAERYCRVLEDRFIRRGSRSGLLQELRSFYRRSRSDKLHHIRWLETTRARERN
jgi:hypothetical protein